MMNLSHNHQRAIRGKRPAAVFLLLVWACVAGLAEEAQEQTKEAAGAPLVKRIDVSFVGGSVTTTPDKVKAMMGTREGQPLDENVLDEDHKRLFKMGIFEDVQIKKEEAEDGVNLSVILREKNVIRRIVFRGNQQVKAKKLQDLIQSKVGERFDAGVVNSDRRKIEDWYHEEFYYFAKVETTAEPFEDGIRLVFEIDEGGRLYIRDIVFRGNHSFSKKELLKYMETRPSTFFTRGRYDRATFEKDLQRLQLFYQSKGYLDAKVVEQPFQITANTPTSRWQRRDAYITIDIEEGDRYRVGRVDFEGNKLVEAEKIRAIIKTMPGEIFSPMTVQEDANRIRDEYGKFPSSRYFTKVYGERVVTPEGPVIDVVFKINEGEEVVVEEVQIVGNTKTKDYVIRREIEQYPGEKIDSVKINESKKNLRNLGYFKNINFDVKEGSAPDRAKVLVDVEEGQTGKLQLGAGISSRESFMGQIQLQQRNFDWRDKPESWKDFFTGKAFCGGGQHFGINLSAGTRSQNYRIDWMNPWMFDKPIRFGLGAFYREWEWSRYDEQRYGGYWKLGKELFGNKHLDGSFTHRIENVQLTDFDPDVSAELRAEEGDNFISRGIFNITWDSRDSIFDPTDGLRLSATQEIAGVVFGGDRDFWRTFLSADYFHPVYKDKQGRPYVISLRGEIGMCEAFGDDERVPIYERMYAGGIGSLRGFGHNRVAPRDDHGDEVGGEMSAVGTVEFFVPVWEQSIRASVFYDIGNVWWQLDGGDKSTDDEDIWRQSAGFGLHLKTPLGPMPIRLYYSFILDKAEGDDEQAFQFTFGAFF